MQINQSILRKPLLVDVSLKNLSFSSNQNQNIPGGLGLPNIFSRKELLGASDVIENESKDFFIC